MITINEGALFDGDYDYNLTKIREMYFDTIEDLIFHIETTTDYDVVNWDYYSVDLINRLGWENERERFKLVHRGSKVTIA